MDVQVTRKERTQRRYSNMKGKKTQARERKEGAGNEKGKKVQQRERKKGTGNEEGKEVLRTGN